MQGKRPVVTLHVADKEAIASLTLWGEVAALVSKQAERALDTVADDEWPYGVREADWNCHWDSIDWGNHEIVRNQRF